MQTLDELSVSRVENDPEALSILSRRPSEQERQGMAGFQNQLPESLPVDNGDPRIVHFS